MNLLASGKLITVTKGHVQLEDLCGYMLIGELMWHAKYTFLWGVLSQMADLSYILFSPSNFPLNEGCYYDTVKECLTRDLGLDWWLVCPRPPQKNDGWYLILPQTMKKIFFYLTLLIVWTTNLMKLTYTLK